MFPNKNNLIYIEINLNKYSKGFYLKNVLYYYHYEPIDEIILFNLSDFFA